MFSVGALISNKLFATVGNLPVFEVEYTAFPLGVFIFQAYVEYPSLPKGYKILLTFVMCAFLSQ